METDGGGQLPALHHGRGAGVGTGEGLSSVAELQRPEKDVVEPQRFGERGLCAHADLHGQRQRGHELGRRAALGGEEHVAVHRHELRAVRDDLLHHHPARAFHRMVVPVPHASQRSGRRLQHVASPHRVEQGLAVRRARQHQVPLSRLPFGDVGHPDPAPHGGRDVGATHEPAVAREGQRRRHCLHVAVRHVAGQGLEEELEEFVRVSQLLALHPAQQFERGLAGHGQRHRETESASQVPRRSVQRSGHVHGARSPAAAQVLSSLLKEEAVRVDGPHAPGPVQLGEAVEGEGEGIVVQRQAGSLLAEHGPDGHRAHVQVQRLQSGVAFGHPVKFLAHGGPDEV